MGKSCSSLSAVPGRTPLLIGVAVALVLNARRLLWPNSHPDPSRSEPLPPGPLGCPFFGHLFSIFYSTPSSEKFGSRTGYFYHKMAKALGFPRIWKFYLMGRGRVAISGGHLVTEMLNKEFDPDGFTSGVNVIGGGVLGEESLMSESDRKRHALVRRLVGFALTPAAVSAAVPNLRKAAEQQVGKMVNSSEPVKMDDICKDFTLDVAWRQILGLKLTEEEIPVFLKAVDEWIGGIFDIRIMLRIGLKSTRSYKARQYLVSKVNSRIDDLEWNGPDASTLSGMVFASDKEDPSQKKLTRQQVIDNALLLILAGSETSASTLTNAILFLGLHPDMWARLKKEQSEMQAKHGDKMPKEILDAECPFLEAVIKETMRITPIGGGAPRVAQDTLVVDGKQIPKGWVLQYSVLLTHELDPTTYKEDMSHMNAKQGFCPERWLRDDTRPSTDFIPMGAGPRYCLGATLAYTEMKVFLAILARRIDFQLVNDTDDIKWKKISIIPKPADGVPIMATANIESFVMSTPARNNSKY